MKPTIIFALMIGIFTTACSQPDSTEKGDASTGPTIELYPTPTEEAQFLQKLGVEAMEKLNACVAKEVTTLVNNVQGKVDAKSTSDIASKAVELCDDLVDDAANEQMSSLKAVVADPNYKPSAAVRERLEKNRSLDDWRKETVDGKVLFGKSYVDTVAKRFQPQLQRQDQSGSSIAPNQ